MGVRVRMEDQKKEKMVEVHHKLEIRSVREERRVE